MCMPHSSIAVLLSLPVAADTLSAMDPKQVFEEIKEAKTKTFRLGVKLGLPISTRRRINSTRLSPDDCLLKTLEEYMKMMNPKPSWGGIATALSSKFVGLPELANRIGGTHCPGISNTNVTFSSHLIIIYP